VDRPFTEAEWLACTGTPARMTRYLRDNHQTGQESLLGRKARLFACAGCRRLASLIRRRRNKKLTDMVEQALGISERFADELAGNEELASLSSSLRSEFLSRTKRDT
jgi:hypothetical protein